MIIVNATAARTGGALTILNGFIEEVSESDAIYIFLVSNDIKFPTKKNIKYFYINTTNWFVRIYWDSFGFNQFLKKHNLNPKLVLNLQNTPVKTKTPQVVYIHQPLILFDGFLSVDIKNFKLILYKYFYSYFIFRYSVEHYIVQAKWIKEGLNRKFNIDKDKVSIVQPDFKASLLSNKDCNTVGKQSSLKSLFYPASPIGYKNHAVILEAMSSKLLDEYSFIVTFSKGDSPLFDKCVLEHNLQSKVIYAGYLREEELKEHYLKASVIVFPSFIETFGLPLLEAAKLNKRIVAADLTYSREVLYGYENVLFSKFDNSQDWVEKIMEIETKELVYSDFKPGVNKNNISNVLSKII